MLIRRICATVLLTILPTAACWSQKAPLTPLQTEQPDPYIWLEDVSSARSMAWVKAENERTAAVLKADPRFSTFSAEALKILQSPDRIAQPDFHDGAIYNTWQDAQHERGILRRTTLADYETTQPHWQTVIDYDALGKADNEKWVSHGLICQYPGNGLCLVALSAGGEDASTLREFDLKTGSFVKGGFVLPKSKQSADWLDEDTLLVARDWGAGSMTKAGYPFIVKEWKRGTPLEQAKEVFRGTENDDEVAAYVANDAQGHQAAFVQRALNFFQSELSIVMPTGVKRIAVPQKIEMDGLLDGKLIITIEEDWLGLSQGSVISLDLADIEHDPQHLKPTVVFAPTAKEFAQGVAITRNHLILTTLENVQGRAYILTLAKKGPEDTWTRSKLPIPNNEALYVNTTNSSDDKFFLTQMGFLTPSTLILGDAATEELKTVKTLPAEFDASNDVVEQLAATSRDGTRVPYFLVHRKDLKYSGANPTLLEAYGGFQISYTPYYSGVLGKLWLERGGVYVLANIRGGGEFGPAWHEAGLKTHRQRIYDDFAAVGQDVVTRRITSPRHLGIVGGSNGGLLVGVEMTQHPDMWNAVVCEVPLLDMLRFEQIAAGTSWIGEYGSVSVPEQRKFLASISPYNQLRPDVTYPEPLIFTTTKDDRVGPQHARKFAARMEEFHKPFFYEEITEGGHGEGADQKERAETSAMQYVYLARKLVD
jgi:prolyl oligopeptidase